MSAKFVSIVLGVGIFFDLSLAEVPSYINVCKRNDPNLDQCIMNAIEALRPKLKDGIPDLEVPAFEPWRIPEEFVLLKSGDFKAIGTDVKVWGISKFKINSLKADLNHEDMKFEFDVTFPTMDIDANYDVNLKILSIYLRGSGPLQSNNTDVEAHVVLKGDLVERGGKKYLEYNDADLKVQWKAASIRLENLFNGDKTLGTAVNNALNQNKKAVMEVFKPRLEKMVAKHVMDVANKINRRYPFDELFPAN